MDSCKAKRIASQTEPEGLEQILDIPYIDDGEKGHLLDIYYPQGTTEKLPVIIDIHGGGIDNIFQYCISERLPKRTYFFAPILLYIKP